MNTSGSFGSSEAFHHMTGKLPSAATDDWLAPRQRPLLTCTERYFQQQPSAAAASDVSHTDKSAVSRATARKGVLNDCTTKITGVLDIRVASLQSRFNGITSKLNQSGIERCCGKDKITCWRGFYSRNCAGPRQLNGKMALQCTSHQNAVWRCSCILCSDQENGFLATFSRTCYGLTETQAQLEQHFEAPFMRSSKRLAQK